MAPGGRNTLPEIGLWAMEPVCLLVDDWFVLSWRHHEKDHFSAIIGVERRWKTPYENYFRPLSLTFFDGE
ncbi:hypothetical protein TVAG_424260 [Trichomonas vaginalis G3]|uniref:Uncharacterized protein n=1 Tax=Trichomonas vaginalis (strain ATCC PRA-98 / G3) TaxID=412133 RepID=A2E1R5_TRIV3|nr:hypothetical protein TVAG_424260 [Trichomonas vaginalis G3]|eukprot:XP_001325617.1 hypothetical protein [Trichomonas vaginalis G3]